MIGIIGAMELEIQKLISDLEEKEVKEIAFLEFYTGKLYSKDVVIVKSNEGKVNSAIATQILISNFDVSYILNVGVAGALDKTLNIYDIAISSNTVEFDQDVTALGYKKGYTFGLDLIYIDAYINIVEKINKICNKLKLTSKIGTIISSDKFIVNEKVVNVNISVGITAYPEITKEIENLLKEVDWAMYYSKQNGRGIATVYSNNVLKYLKMIGEI